MANVTVIPATKNIHTKAPVGERQKRRVAGYARVSTDSDEQFTSYQAQVDYYTGYIQNNPDWEFVKVYTDEGISAVSTKHREGFKAMIKDALNGEIDLIITKSVSRFARNTVDSLTTIRKLKKKGCECFFEKENIWTFDSKGELLITIMSSLAQEESRSISENVTWGQRKRFADGKVSMPYSSFLGYRKGADGQPEIEPEQAKLVRRIYRMYMDGLSANTIATQLTAESIPTPGNRKVWQNATIMSILKNEKYKGSALLQKRFTVDFLTKKVKENEGEVPQYYVEESHPAIIKPEEWDAVQVEIAARRTRNRPYRCTSPFSGKIICGDCGGIFGSKVWHSTDKYSRTIWQCNNKFMKECKCKTPHLYEEEIKDLFIKVLEEYLSDREELVRELQYLQENLCNTDFVDADMQSVEQEMDILTAAMRQCIMENASASVTEEQYRDKYADLCCRFEEQKAKYEKLQAEKQQAEDNRIIIGGLLFEITELTDLPITFKESLWNATVDHITVFNDDRVVFTIKDGKEITVRL